MSPLQPPQLDPVAVFELCRDSIGDDQKRSRVGSAQVSVVARYAQYQLRANGGALNELPCTKAKKDEVVLDASTRRDLEDLYTKEMVPESKPARAIYDALRAAPVNAVCPTCGVGHVFTLDHFLPKSRFPWFAVMPANLVPACRDCNTGKLAKVGDAVVPFHPYFDHQSLRSVWISAVVLRTRPISIRFTVNPPPAWDEERRARAVAHFEDYNLGQRFATEAARDLGSLKGTVRAVPLSVQGLREHVYAVRVGHQESNPTGWKAAMYCALDSDAWFAEAFLEEALG